MGHRLISYKNELWKVIHDFKCTNSDQPFILQPGKYLFICKGGASDSRSVLPSLGLIFGGVSMGVLDLTDTTTFHAVVGGNSVVDANTIKQYPAKGGFNGGSSGGTKRTASDSYYNGAGGGGASDIRLLPYDQDEYPTYDEDGTFHEPAEQPLMLTDSSNHQYYQLEYLRGLGSYKQDSTATNNSYILTDYAPNKQTKIVFDGVVISSDNVNMSWVTIFGSRTGSSRNMCDFFIKSNTMSTQYYCRNSQEISFNHFTYDQHIELVCYKERAEWFINNVSQGFVEIPNYQDTEMSNTPTLCIFGTHEGSSSVNYYGGNIQLFGFKIYEVDPDTGDETLVRDYIPAQSVSTQAVSTQEFGLFDNVNKNFIACSNPGGIIGGPKKRTSPSINSRIIVAGGAGAELIVTNPGGYYDWPIQYGGGIATTGCSTMGQRDPNGDVRINQTFGYARGYAQVPIGHSRYNGSNHTFYHSGSSGSGGGWFGGFSHLSSFDESFAGAMTGSGGTGYVLTSQSYKPSGYNPSAKYYMSNIYMGAGQSSEGEVIVAKLGTYSVGDTIEFYSTAQSTSLTLKPGTYQLSCYGGGSFSRTNHNDSSRTFGGFAQGTLSILDHETIHVNVGGRGMPTAFGGKSFENTAEYANMMFPYSGYNGGGNIGDGYSPNPRIFRGGGATDMRIGGDTLYHRFIVAGGAGSDSLYVDDLTRVGGDGGGLTGGGIAISSYVNGPGTQTESPSNQYAATAGSFGQGGYSEGYYSGYSTGCGGGGWYGGSGARGGSSGCSGTGGSGYVLTEDSYKPDGYLVDDEYYLSETSLVQGGNTREDQQPFAEITVIEVLTPIIAHDNDGYKYYERSISRWKLIQPQPSRLTKDVFDAYPDSIFMNDTNLMDEYQLYVCDETEEITSIGLLTTPYRVRISTDTNNSSTINNIYIDSDPYDDAVFSPNVHVIKDQTTHKNRVIFDVYKHQPGDQIFKLYNVELTGSPGQQASYRYFSKSDVTPSTECLPNNPCYGTLVKPRGEMEDYRDETGRIETAQYLLPLRINGSYGLRSEYVLDLYDNGTSSITTSCSVEFRRKFYTASSCCINGTWYLQIKSFDPSALTDQVHLEWQATWTTLAGSNTGYAASGFLMDENKFYFTSSHANDRIFIVNRVSDQVSGYVIPDNGHAYINGRIEWYDDTHTSIVTGDNNAKHDVYLFNIKSNQYIVLSDNSPGVNWWDLAVSDKTILLVDKDSNYCHINIYNKQSKTWTTINQNDYGEEFGCCYGDGKFYVITPTHLIVIEDKTPYTIAKSYYVEWGYNNKVIRPTYCNGAVIVPRYNYQWLYVFNLKREIYSMMYLAWNTNTHEASRGNMCSPCSYRSYYFYPGGVSALYLNYMGNDKYNIGYKYAQYQISYNTESESSFEYDDTYVEMTDACALISDGYQLYEVEEYDENHVTHIDVSKENYQFAYGLKLYKGDE